jgi:hypothetical protein
MMICTLNVLLENANLFSRVFFYVWLLIAFQFSITLAFEFAFFISLPGRFSKRLKKIAEVILLEKKAVHELIGVARENLNEFLFEITFWAFN